VAHDCNPHPTQPVRHDHAPTLSVVGAIAFAVHVAVVVLLVPLGVAPLSANVAAFVSALVVSLAGHYVWTLRAQALRPAVGLGRFTVVAAVGFVLNEASYAALLTDTAIDYRVALLLVLAAVAALTSVAAREWAFANA
jgi:putative flippase GtrA